MSSSACKYEIGIVGAGFSGITMAIELIKTNYTSLVIFEKSGELGGVWRDNIYPGCSCDIKSTLYSISSEPNPNWTATYPKQEELLDYLVSTAAKHNLGQYIKYDTEIQNMAFNEQNGRWLVNSKTEYYSIKTMIMATGPQRLPKIPEFPGRKSFKGESFHSARWDQNCDLEGSKVAVIGTGASGIQIVPNIRDKVSRLYVFQRSPAWVLPRWERKISNTEKWLYKKFPFLQLFQRKLNFWFLEFIGTSFLWNKWLHRLLTKIALFKIKKEVDDPKVQEKLTPDYPLGCKRILVSDKYYRSFNKPHVDLVSENIEHISGEAIHTCSSWYEVDTIIYATGFTVADVEHYIEITGLNNRKLNTYWREKGAEAYYGINVAYYPNLCFLLGPNSGLSHSSALHAMESQVSYIMKYISSLKEQGENAYFDIQKSTQDAYNQRIQNKLKSTIWNSGCSSWFINKDGKNTVIFPGTLTKYRKLLHNFNSDKYMIGNNGR